MHLVKALSLLQWIASGITLAAVNGLVCHLLLA